MCSGDNLFIKGSDSLDDGAGWTTDQMISSGKCMLQHSVSQQRDFGEFSSLLLSVSVVL